MYLPNTPKDDEFIKRGYHAYAPLAIDNPSIAKRFQKRFDDDTGKKYFIIGDKPINLTFHSSWTIERVEQYVEKMFQLGLFDYYEKWE